MLFSPKFYFLWFFNCFLLGSLLWLYFVICFSGAGESKMASDGFMHSLGPITGSFSVQSLCWPRPRYVLLRVLQYVRIGTYSLGSRTPIMALLLHSFGLNTSQGQPDSIHFWIEGVLLWFTIRRIYLIFVPVVPGTELLKPLDFSRWQCLFVC